MAPYQELKDQAAALLAEAESMRQLEIDGVITTIKEQIQTYGLTAHDLGLNLAPKVKRKSTSPIKYRGPHPMGKAGLVDADVNLVGSWQPSRLARTLIKNSEFSYDITT